MNETLKTIIYVALTIGVIYAIYYFVTKANNATVNTVVLPTTTTTRYVSTGYTRPSGNVIL